jgi:hypothetical protein
VRTPYVAAYSWRSSSEASLVAPYSERGRCVGNSSRIPAALTPGTLCRSASSNRDSVSTSASSLSGAIEYTREVERNIIVARSRRASSRQFSEPVRFAPVT